MLDPKYDGKMGKANLLPHQLKTAARIEVERIAENLLHCPIEDEKEILDSLSQSRQTAVLAEVDRLLDGQQSHSEMNIGA